MRAIAVIITCLLGLSCASTKSVAQAGAAASTNNGNNSADWAQPVQQPASNASQAAGLSAPPADVTAVATEKGIRLASGAKPLDAQTLRVAQEPVIWKMIKPFEKKYKAQCAMYFGDQASNKNPHWTCLNNSACSYAVVLFCANRKNPTTARLSLEVDGFDDGKDNQIQGLSVTYPQK